MKNKLYFFASLSVLALAFWSCDSDKDIVVPQTTVIEDNGKPFVATTESYSHETKTSLNNGNVLWKTGDQVSVFAASTTNDQYQVTDDSNGKTSASLNKIPAGGFVAGVELDDNVAYYPYSASNEVVKNGSDYDLTVSLPSTQNYAENSFGNGAFPMVAVTNGSGDMNLTFKNVLGGLKLQLKGTATISRITVTGNNNEILYGDATVTASKSSVPTITLSNASAKVVTLNCGAGVALDAETATSFIIALPPMTMTGGFTVVVKDTEGKEMEIKTTRSQTIIRSSLLKMPAVDYVGTAPLPPTGIHDYVDLGFRKSHIDDRITPGSEYDRKIVFATCNIGADSPEDFGYYFRWGELYGWKIVTDTPNEYGNAFILSATQHDKDGNTLSSTWNSSTFSNSYALSGGTSLEGFKGKTNLEYNGTVYGDAATYNWGEPWVTPDYPTFFALLGKPSENIALSSGPVDIVVGNNNGSVTLTYSYAEQNGVIGLLIENRAIGESIFIPGSGCCEREQLLSAGSFNDMGEYWCSSKGSNNGAGYYMQYNYNFLYLAPGAAFYGDQIRPVAELTLSDEYVPTELPSITNAQVQRVDYRKATVSSSLVGDGNAITEFGFYYGTSEGAMNNQVCVSGHSRGYSPGDFSKEITGLNSGTTYYIKAYATNEVGTVESNVVSFTTMATSGTLNGFEWVDIGIRKSQYDTSIEPGSAQDRRIVIAKYNIGTTSSSAPGYFFRGDELYGWKYSGSATNTPNTQITSSNLKQVDNNGNTLRTFRYDNFYWDDSDETLDFEIEYETGNAVNYYYGNEWIFMPSALARKLYGNSGEYFDNLPSTVTITNKGLNGITLTYTFESRGLTISNRDIGSSVFFPSDGVIKGPYSSCRYYPTNSADFWIDGHVRAIYGGGVKEALGVYLDWEDMEIDDYTTKTRYCWMVIPRNIDAYQGRHIRAIAELPL